LKKPTGSVRFYKPETKKTNRTKPKPKKPRKKPDPNRKKTEPNQKNRAKLKKPSQTSLNRFCPKKRTETGRFEPVSVFF
jgi:hypothetical protein